MSMQKPHPRQRRSDKQAEHHGEFEEQLKRLGLVGLDIAAQLAWATQHKASAHELIARVLEEAVSLKRVRSLESRIERSGIKVRKTMAVFEWNFQPKLDRHTVEELFSLGFLKRHDDILLTGKTGTGKSHLLIALALKACEQEVTVQYSRCVDLVDDLYAGLADGTYEKRMRRWCRAPLLVIDDVGLGQLRRRADEPTAAHMLFTLLDRRHTMASTAITSNIKLSEWGKYLGDATLAAAVLDRLAATAIRIDIDGPSYRQYLAKQRSQQQTQAFEPTTTTSEEPDRLVDTLQPTT